MAFIELVFVVTEVRLVKLIQMYSFNYGIIMNYSFYRSNKSRNFHNFYLNTVLKMQM